MKICIHPIATIIKTSGLNGDVRLRPLSRYFEEHIESNRLMLGVSSENSEVVRLELITGLGKKRRFNFAGLIMLRMLKALLAKLFMPRLIPMMILT